MLKIDEDILSAAVETYKLEKSIEPDNDALSAALAAGFAVVERRTMERMVIAAEELAGHLEEVEEFPSYEAIATLKLFAHDIKAQLPNLSDRYDPKDEDIVEVILSGEVRVYQNECRDCGHMTEETTWSVMDRATNMEYFFDPLEAKDLRVRVISPGISDFLADA